MLLEIQDKEMSDLYIDAIVCPVDRFLNMQTEVAKGIGDKGGHVIQREAKRKGTIPIGDAVVTTSGALLTMFVIHGAIYTENLNLNEDTLYNFILNSLRRSEEMDLESVGFPILEEFTEVEYAAVIGDALEAFLSESEGKIRTIVFSSEKDSLRALFEKALRQKNIFQRFQGHS